MTTSKYRQVQLRGTLQGFISKFMSPSQTQITTQSMNSVAVRNSDFLNSLIAGIQLPLQLPGKSANFLPKLPANFLQTSCKLPVNFLQTSYELPTNFLRTSYQLPTNFLPTSCQLPVHFLQTSSKLRANRLHNRLPTAFKIDFRTKTTWKLLGSSQH